MSADVQPQWVQSPHRLYPSEQYLTGLGEAESREQAEKRAYAAVARIFSANVQAQSMDYESYAMQENDVRSRTQRTVQLNQRTHVTTSKILQNVKILDVWYHNSTKHFFVLAGMDRRQAEEALVDRLRNIDGTIENLVQQGRSHPQKIQRIRGYKQAMVRLSERKLLNADLRVIRANGKSQPPSYLISDIQREFQNFVTKNFIISIAIKGENHEELERAILEGLEEEGLRGRVASMGIKGAGRIEDVTITGQSQVWTIDLPDPLFKYVRWCGAIDIYEQPSQQLIGVISETGREGHVTEQEAKVRANKTMRQVLSQKVTNLLTQSIFHPENSSGEQKRLSKGCPQ